MFKRIKTTGLALAALLPMLGTEAEAHYIYANGRWYYHSVGCDVTIGDLPLSPDPLVVKCDVGSASTTTVVETLCPGPSIVSLSIPGLLLAAQTQTAPGQTRVEVLVPDSPLLNLGACGSVAPIAVLIRSMVSTVTISQCVGLGGSCSVGLVTSTATATCALPAQFNLTNYPVNLPPDGTPFTCTAPLILHVN